MATTGRMPSDPRSLVRRFPYTVVTLAVAVGVFVAAVMWHIDVFELPGFDLIGIAHSEAGEVVIAFLLILPALFVDRVVARQRAYEGQLQAEQLRVLRVTMRTVQDIVNNNLNQLQLLRLDAEGHVPDASLVVFDRAIQDTAAQLTALSNIDVFAEKPMESGQGVDVSRSR